MRVFMIGFMASGKSTFGARLAKKLDYPFVDLEEYIEEKYNSAIKDIFSLKGEPYFRKIERQSLLELMEQENIVVAAGATTPCFVGNMELMNEKGLTIYIRQGANCLYSRLNRGKKFRSLIENMSHFQLIEYLETNLAKRKPFYEQAKYNILGKNLRTKILLDIVKREMKQIA
ncbi:MAG: shikimate kinase [Bacteroidales bacterium]|nr:shikimate kinase [Bacteroidales bacterium]